MQNPDESQLIEGVVDRLAQRFPQTPRPEVARVVAEAHQELEGNPIRDYVPVLVEREARKRLRETTGA